MGPPAEGPPGRPDSPSNPQTALFGQAAIRLNQIVTSAEAGAGGDLPRTSVGGAPLPYGRLGERRSPLPMICFIRFSELSELLEV
jgi:hypothetical protein